MIGFILRGLGFGGPDLLTIVAGSALACCALFGVYKCSRCRMRDCGCIKRCMRAAGADKFDDFELIVVVHEAMYTASTMKLSTCVRLTAQQHQVTTDPNNKGIFQQPLALLVEQGTENVLVELMDSNGRTVLANLKLDVEKDVLKEKVQREKIFAMKQKSKGVLNPRIKLTVRLEDANEEEGLLANIPATSAETNMMLREQLHKVTIEAGAGDGNDVAAARPLSTLDLLSKGCAGPLDMFGSWGSREQVYIAIKGPPEQKKYAIGIWGDQHQYEKGHKVKDEVELLKIQGVQPDPGRAEVFIINYVQAEKVKKRLTFRRIDRARDVWVEMFTLLIKMLRESKEAKKKKVHHIS